MTVSRDEVVWAYTMILGREPENEVAIEGHSQAETLQGLRENLFASQEFRQTRGGFRAPSTTEVDRLANIREFITKEHHGLEIGPWFNPLCPRADDFNVLTLDVFDQAELRVRAQQDPSLTEADIARIEPVDLVGSVTGLLAMAEKRKLIGSLDYVVSSHNFEHIPDPIRFLQACEKVLKPNGVISMALPDRRTCFDHFRPHSVTGDILEAYWQKRVRPTPAQIFSHVALHAKNKIGGVPLSGWGLNADPATVELQDNIANAMQVAAEHLADPDAPYFDAHCWAFTPTSFEVIIEDLRALGLTGLSIRKITTVGGHEFFVHLVNDAGRMPDASSPEFSSTRSELLRRTNDESAEHARLTRP